MAAIYRQIVLDYFIEYLKSDIASLSAVTAAAKVKVKAKAAAAAVKVKVKAKSATTVTTSVSTSFAAMISNVSLQTYDLHGRQLDVVDKKIFAIGQKPIRTMDRYAILGCGVKFHVLPLDMNYVFPLPLTVLSWQRLNFGTIVFLAGNYTAWIADPALTLIMRSLVKLGSILLFVPTPENNTVMISQAGREFIAGMLPSPEFDGVYLMTSDADIFPLDADTYEVPPPPGKLILAANNDWCPNITYKNTRMKMMCMSCIGMAINTWREIMNIASESITEFKDIHEYLRKEFGDEVDMPVVKRGAKGWNFDQKLISSRVYWWVKARGDDLILAEPRKHDLRVNRANWARITRYDTGEKWVDSHILENCYRPWLWRQMLPLLRWMHGANSTQMRFLIDYQILFRNITFPSTYYI